MARVKQIADLAKAEISAEVAAAYAGRELRFGPDYLIPTPFDSRLILRIPRPWRLPPKPRVWPPGRSRSTRSSPSPS